MPVSRLQQSVSRPPRALVATAGPASFGSEHLLLESGATTIRLNASHLGVSEVVEHCRRITAIDENAHCVVDLQGAKMRLGAIPERTVHEGEMIWLSSSPAREDAVYVPHPELFEQSQVGETLSIDDGRLLLTICETAPSALRARIDREYVLKPRKGVNRREHPIVIEDLSPDDQAMVLECRNLERVAFAISFVTDGREASWVKRRAPSARLTLKIERQEALDHLAKLAEMGDELWICRGDLGAQLGVLQLGHAISTIAPAQFEVPVLMAGQVLEHLTLHREPTRSEICHVHDLSARSYAGIVLSDETAIGNHPVSATRWARQLLDAS